MSTCAPSHTLPDMVVALRVSSTSTSTAGISAVHAAPADQLRNGPRRPGHQVRPESLRRQARPAGQRRKLCMAKTKAQVNFVGQNNRVANSQVSLNPSCGEKSARRSRKARAAGKVR